MSNILCDSFWRASAPAAPKLKPLAGHFDVDVAIVGGGFTGLSAALHIQRRYEQLVKRGAPVQLLSAAEAQARIGSTKFNGALFDPRAGTIQPLAYARGLAKATLVEGAKLFDQSPVKGVLPDENSWIVQTQHGDVRAHKVVLATNAYSEHGVVEQTRKYVPISYSQLASKPLSDAQLAVILPNKEGVWDTCTVMSSFRLDQQGRLIFGGMGGESDVLKNWASQRVKDLFPILNHVAWEYCWTGQIAYSEDHQHLSVKLYAPPYKDHRPNKKITFALFYSFFFEKYLTAFLSS